MLFRLQIFLQLRDAVHHTSHAKVGQAKPSVRLGRQMPWHPRFFAPFAKRLHRDIPPKIMLDNLSRFFIVTINGRQTLVQTVRSIILHFYVTIQFPFQQFYVIPLISDTKSNHLESNFEFMSKSVGSTAVPIAFVSFVPWIMRRNRR